MNRPSSWMTPGYYVRPLKPVKLPKLVPITIPQGYFVHLFRLVLFISKLSLVYKWDETARLSVVRNPRGRGPGPKGPIFKEDTRAESLSPRVRREDHRVGA